MTLLSGNWPRLPVRRPNKPKNSSHRPHLVLQILTKCSGTFRVLPTSHVSNQVNEMKIAIKSAPELNSIRAKRGLLIEQLSNAKRLLLGWLLVWTAANCVQAQLNPSATLSSQPAGLNFNYTLTLNNNSTPSTPIETLWYAWVPGSDFLPTSPTSVQAPAGWTGTIMGGGPGDGFSIEFTTSTAPLNPGNSLTFQFQSSDTPAQLAGNSPFFPTMRVGTSYVYEGSPFLTAGGTFVVQSVPEPSTMALLLVGGLGLLRRRLMA
jgi:hypothetical protein